MAAKETGDDGTRGAPVVIGDDGGGPLDDTVKSTRNNRLYGMHIRTKYDFAGLEKDVPAPVHVVGGSQVGSAAFNDGTGSQPIPGLDNFSAESKESNNRKKWINGHYDQGSRTFVISASDTMQKIQDPTDHNYFYFFWTPAVIMASTRFHGNNPTKTVGPGTLSFELR